MSPSAAVGTEAPKQQLTQDNQTQCLPETDGLGREYLWHQRVPEAHHHKADDPYGNNREKNHLKSSQCPITSHLFLTSAQIRCRWIAISVGDATPRIVSATAMYSGQHPCSD